jgi:hypothetical protein
MKTLKWLTVLTLLLYVSNMFSQVAYYDAVELSKKAREVNGVLYIPGDDSTLLLLVPYVNNPNPSKQDIIKEFQDNPFFKVTGQPMGFLELSATRNKAASFISGLNVTNFADGLAKFLVKRAKEELYVSFFEKFKDYITTSAPELKVLFPYTVVLLENFQSWEYANIINTLREAFDNDLQMLLSNFPGLRNMDTTNVAGNAKIRVKKLTTFLNSDEGLLFLAAIEIGNGIIAKDKIPDVFHYVNEKYFSQLHSIPKIEDVRSSIDLLDIISYSLKSNKYRENYIGKPQIKDLVSVKEQRNTYLGLLYQQIKKKNIVINGIVVADELGKSGNITQYIQNLSLAGNNILNAMDSLIRNNSGGSDLQSQWSAAFLNANEFIKASADIKLINPKLQLPERLGNVFKSSQQTLEISYDISVKNYSAATIKMVKFISDHTKNIDPRTKEILVKYLSFASNVASASSSNEIEAAIEAVALPAGSASIKKNTCFNVSINAYLGGFAGKEYLPDNNMKNWANTLGVSAPVGLAFSKGLDKCGSLSLFVSVIDVGAFASYRLKDTSATELPKVTLQNIFAPGVGIVYGIPKWPISIGYMHQWGPALREITSTAAKINSSDLNRRWFFFIAVDIPIANLYTKPKG